MLGDSNTWNSQENPTEEKKRTLKALLKPILESKKITQDAYDHLIPTASITPWIYRTTKIHKKDTPLRLIVDSIGSVTYNLSKALVKIIKPILGLTEHQCKNSKQLAQELDNLKVETDEILISHDVVSLLTKPPLTSHYISSRNNSGMTGHSKTHKPHSWRHIPTPTVRCQIHLLSIQRQNIKTKRRFCNRRSTISNNEQFFHWRPGNQSHKHSTHTMQTHSLEKIRRRHPGKK